MNAYRPTIVEVDLEAIRHNVRTLKPGSAELMAVVKADGYGHGAVNVARAALAAGATWLGVALVEEGVALRDGGLDAPILVLSEFPPGSEKDALAAGLTPTVYTDRAVQAVAEAARSLDTTAGVHVKVDTGMHRVGLHPPGDAPDFVARAVAAGCRIDAVWTHFARAEEDEATTRAQLALFQEVLDGLGERPRLVHAANSAAAILYPETHFDLVRVGIALYGLDPGGGLGRRAGLRPALTWRSEVSAVRQLPAGEPVSYGHRYRLGDACTVATVPVGYADGYRRALSSRADVLIGGRRRRVAGTVTMDQIVVDCGQDHVAAGDEVVLIGRQGEEEITADELAGLCDTINYEITCGLGPRVPREASG
ncbi:MAG: alanine racemase [Actinomycetota bacterium]